MRDHADTIRPERPSEIDRRAFGKGMLAAATATQCGLLGFASSLFADDRPVAIPKANVHVLVVRPKEHAADITWPGGQVDIEAMQKTFTKALTDATGPLAVQLDVRPKPISTQDEVKAYLQEVGKTPPDGIIVLAMELKMWPVINALLKDRGDIPAIVYSNMSSFTGHQQPMRALPKTILAATHEVEWLRIAVRMFHTMVTMKHTRIALVADRYRDKTPLSVWKWGPNFHYVSEKKWVDVIRALDESDEMRAMADHYSKHAQRIVEPSPKDVIGVAKVYVALRKIMQEENCQGITCNCLPFAKATGDTACLPYSRLQDEGIVACCEADLGGATLMLLSHHLLRKPAFIQDPSPNTVNNTLIASHCTMARKIKGLDDPYEASYLLRDYHTRSGVAVQVLWPVDSPVTVVEQQGDSILLGTGRVVGNIPDEPARQWGGCRTSIEIRMDEPGDTRDIQGFHQAVIHGNHARLITQYAELVGLGISPLSMKRERKTQASASRCSCRCHC